MRRPTAVVVFLLAAGLFPLWYVALSAGSATGRPSLGTGADPVAVNASAHAFTPTVGFLSGAPVEVGATQAGVVTWIALFVLVAGLVLAFRFVDRLGGRHTTPHGGAATPIRVPSFFLKGDRRVLEYVRPAASRGALAAVGALTWVSVVLTALFVYEGVTLARTQFLGLYLGGLLLTLALLVVVYAAYFVPHVTVVEPREHARERVTHD